MAIIERGRVRAASTLAAITGACHQKRVRMPTVPTI
ncbi:hypothetical protein B0G84_4199 [Paraburkholderia sp. BL8N3]|jgi:hypothetical protein|nr:hypothetical protein B0G84_4199 [Paraburkholderia sp. BL8N3]